MTIVGELGPSDFSERTRFHAPPPGLEPRQRVPKTRVLPLHHGGTAEFHWGNTAKCLLCHIMPTQRVAR